MMNTITNPTESNQTQEQNIPQFTQEQLEYIKRLGREKGDTYIECYCFEDLIDDFILMNGKTYIETRPKVKELNQEISRLKRKLEINKLMLDQETEEAFDLHKIIQKRQQETNIIEDKLINANREINHLKEVYKLVNDKNKIYKDTMKQYKQDFEEFNSSVGIVNVMSIEYDKIKLNRNRIVKKYHNQNKILKDQNFYVNQNLEGKDRMIKRICKMIRTLKVLEQTDDYSGLYHFYKQVNDTMGLVMYEYEDDSESSSESESESESDDE